MSRSPLHPVRAVRAAVAALALSLLPWTGVSAQETAGGALAPGGLAGAVASEAPASEAAVSPPGSGAAAAGPAAPDAPAPGTLAFPAAQAPAPAISPSRPLALEPLARAWHIPTPDLAERSARVRAAADALGVGDVEPLARALLIDSLAGGALSRATAAVELAPNLPAAQLALAASAWREGAGTGVALAAAARAAAGLARHLESLLWLEATASTLLCVAALAAGLLWIAARGALAAATAAHDLADSVDPELPGFARAAMLAVLVLAPAALGEGLLGAALALFALAWWAGDRRQRRALAAAAALVVVGLGPLAGLAGRALLAPLADPVALAVAHAETGILDPADSARLERAAAAGDPLAVEALARWARRAGDTARAEALLAPLLEGDGARDPRLLNDAAHVKLVAGDTAGAIALYRRAIEIAPSAELWFNLAQAHVRAIDMDAHAAALASAQALDAGRTSALTRRLSESDALVDLVPSAFALRGRMVAAAGPAAGAALRAPVAPGRLGRAPWLAALAFALLAAGAGALSRRTTPSRGCRDCSARMCPRCGSGDPREERCAGCARRRLEARHGGPWEPRERASAAAGLAAALRAAARVLPGLADREPGRPGLALAALAALAASVALASGRSGVVADPAAVGGAGPLSLAVAAGALLAAGVVLTAWSRRAGGR